MAAQSPEYRWTLGDRIRKARMNAGMKQAELASRLTAQGFPSSTARIGAWENAGKQPRRLYDVLRAVAEITGAPYDWLVSGGQESVALTSDISPLAEFAAA